MNVKNYFLIFAMFFPKDKKGMSSEAWQIAALVLAAFLLLFYLVWSGVLGQDLSRLFDKLGDLF